MSANSATRVQDPGRIEATELRALLAAMTSARDGDFTKAPETGEDLAAELGAMFNQIMDRSRHCNAELTRVRREIVRHEGVRRADGPPVRRRTRTDGRHPAGRRRLRRQVTQMEELLREMRRGRTP
ncbi:hypothetical protein [Streptomyces sp. NBC_01361]|uniref:hypothetical protein n=1 Tax=Streptomyces sp. NBC_01361 TaxID=2903838 RepID=UPI002E345D96|nr:hypothetical protein [Streptomyces sp. NBC_01361]